MEEDAGSGAVELIRSDLRKRKSSTLRRSATLNSTRSSGSDEMRVGSDTTDVMRLRHDARTSERAA